MGWVEMLFVVGSVLMLNRVHVQGACEVAAAHIDVCLCVCLSSLILPNDHVWEHWLPVRIGADQVNN